MHPYQIPFYRREEKEESLDEIRERGLRQEAQSQFEEVFQALTSKQRGADEKVTWHR